MKINSIINYLILCLLIVTLASCGKSRKSGLTAKQQELIEYNNELVREEKYMSDKIAKSVAYVKGINKLINEYLASPTTYKKSVQDVIKESIIASKNKLVKSKEIIMDKTPPNKLAKDIHKAYVYYYEQIISAFDYFEKTIKNNKKDYSKEKQTFFDKIYTAQENIKKAQQTFFDQHRLPIKK